MEQYLDPKSIIFTSRIDAEIVLQYLKDLINENYRWYEGKELIDYLKGEGNPGDFKALHISLKKLLKDLFGLGCDLFIGDQDTVLNLPFKIIVPYFDHPPKERRAA